MDVFTADALMVIAFYLLLIISIPFSWAQESGKLTAHPEAPLEIKSKQDSKLVFLDFMSWQQEGTIKSGTTSNKIILTNKAFCIGGAIGFEVNKYRTFLDGCFLHGSGNVGSEKSDITYNQSSITAWGAKASMGIGRFVSPVRAEIGLKLPIMYVHQSLKEPAGSKVHEPEPFMLMASLYSRWPFQKWFMQTEFSKIIGNDLVLFSLGGGYQF